jgi:hypothetical protein
MVASCRALCRIICALFFTLSVSNQALCAEVRELTDIQGRSIRAEVKKVDGDEVIIERDDGRSFTIAINRFIEKDREYIRARGLEIKNSVPPRLVVDFLRTQDDRENNYGDPDDRQVSFRPTVVIENKDRERTFDDVEVTCIVVGESVFTTDQLKLLAVEKLRGDLPINEKVRLTGKKVTLKYDENPGNGHAHGYRYGGYVVLIHAKTGHLLYSKASKSAWMEEDFAERVDELSMEVCYDRDLKMEVLEQFYADFY